MPIFFPLCVIGLWILYACDKLRMTYQYKQPPLYDARMSIYVINILVYSGPTCMLLFGYWDFTNSRVFDNKSIKLNYTYDQTTLAVDRMNPFNFSSKFLHAAPLFFMIFIVLLFLFLIFTTILGAYHAYLITSG